MNKTSLLLLVGLLLAGCAGGGKRISSGTGFLVGDAGHVITNRHVVKHCSQYQVNGNGMQAQATLVALDDDADLALLKLPGAAKGASFSAQTMPLRAWDQLTIIGYPGNTWQRKRPVMTKASLLDLRGPQGEAGLMQFSDSVAKGNSGGPLLDASGNVVGVVVAKSTKMRIESKFWPGSDVERSDVAITLATLEKFLRRQQVHYTVSNTETALSDARIYSKSAHFIVNIQCVIE